MKLGRFIARPSFGAESCVSVHAEISEEAKKKHGGSWAVPDSEKKYFITVTQASESLWYSWPNNNDGKKEKKVKITRIDREIEMDLAIAIQRHGDGCFSTLNIQLITQRGWMASPINFQHGCEGWATFTGRPGLRLVDCQLRLLPRE